MDVPETPTSQINDSNKEYVIAYGYNLYLNKEKSPPEHFSRPKKSISKLPRSIKAPKMWNAAKGLMKSYGDHPGTPRPGCSNAAISEPTCRRDTESHKLNKSNIPRRTWSLKKEREKNTQNANADYSGRGPKCQRVQMVNIRPDYSANEHPDSPSLASAKPIPPVGPMFKNINNDRLNDWFVQSVNDYISVPPNSFMSTYRAKERSGVEETDTAREVVDIEICSTDLNQNRSIDMAVNSDYVANAYNSSEEQVQDWLGSESQYRRKDEEVSSVYCLVDPDNSSATENLGNTNKVTKNTSSGEPRSTNVSAQNSSVATMLSSQPTVLLRDPTLRNRPDSSLSTSNDPSSTAKGCPKQGVNKNFQFPSHPPDLCSLCYSQPVRSFVDCSSEILQKTTNLDNILVTCPQGDNLIGSHHTDSTAAVCNSQHTDSIAATDLEVRDDFSQYALEYMDDHSECHGSHSRHFFTYEPQGSDQNPSKDNWEYRYEYVKCDKGINEYCRNCQKDFSDRSYKRNRFRHTYHMRHASVQGNRRTLHDYYNFYKIQRIKITKICCMCYRRWNTMWRKTQARARRCAIWNRTRLKSQGYRAMSYIQRTVFCEDVEMQTSLLVFRDTATLTEKDQKSIAIVTSLRINSWLAAYNKLHSASKKSSFTGGIKLADTIQPKNPFDSLQDFLASKQSFWCNKRHSYSSNPKSTSFPTAPVAKWNPVSSLNLRQSSPPRYSLDFKTCARQTDEIQSRDGSTGMEDENPFTEDKQSQHNFEYIQNPSFPGWAGSGLKISGFKNSDFLDNCSVKLTSSCDTKPRLFRTLGNLSVKGETPFSSLSMRPLRSPSIFNVGVTPATEMPMRVSMKSYQQEFQKMWRKESPKPSLVLQMPSQSNAIMTQTHQTQPEKPNTCIACTSVSQNDLPKKECAVITDCKDPVLTLTGIKVLSISSSILGPKEVAKVAGVATSTCTNSGVFRYEESTSANDLPSQFHIEASMRKVSANIGTVAVPRHSFGMATSEKKIETMNKSVGLAMSTKTPITIISIGSENNGSSNANVNKTNCHVQYNLEDISNRSSLKRFSASVNTDAKCFTTKAVQPIPSAFMVLDNKNYPQFVQYINCAEDEIHTKRDTGTSTNLVSTSKCLSAIERPEIQKSVHVQYSSLLEDIPSCSSAGVSTDIQSTQSVGEMTVKSATDYKNKKKVDATIQYSNYNSIYSNPRSTKIGRSQLMSVFALCKSVREISTQVTPSIEQETNVKLEVPKISQSVQSTMTHTSRFDVGDPAETLTTPLYENTDTYITSQRSIKAGHKQPLSVFALCNSMREIATQMTPITEQDASEKLEEEITMKNSVKMPLQPVKPTLNFGVDISTGISTLAPIVENAEKTGAVQQNLTTGKTTSCGQARVGSYSQDIQSAKTNSAKFSTSYPIGCNSSLVTHSGIPSRSPMWLPKALSSCTYKHKRLRPRSPTFKLDSTMDAHLICLSRLMGKPTRYSCRSESSSLNAAKWIRRCGIPIGSQNSKDYQSVVDVGKVTSDSLKQEHSLKQDQCHGSCRVKTLLSPASSQKFQDSYLSTSGMPELLMTLSRDSLADVLPRQEPTQKISIALSSHAVEVAMVDKVTSDVSPVKELKECELQATPDICDAATDSVPIVLKHHKSASALTSRVVLLPCHCKGHESNLNRDCMFIYDRPKCLVHHKSLTDVSIQRHPSSRDVGLISPEMEPRKEHAVDEYVGSVTSVATTCCFHKLSDRSREGSSSRPKPDILVDEVLSPRVYKALYETSKLVEKALPRPYSEVSHITHTGMATDNYETSNLSTQIFTPEKLSAAILTSHYSCDRLLKDMNTGEEPYCKRSLTSAMTSPGGFESALHCSISTQPDSLITFTKTAHPKDGVTQYCSSCRARVTMPHAEVVDTACGSIEECMRSHLMGSCRYYSSLLTRHIGRVKDTLAKQLNPDRSTSGKSDLTCMDICPATTQREELNYQIQQHEKACFEAPELESTKHTRRQGLVSLPSCYVNNVLSSLEICGDDKENLKMVYYTLSAIEGRIRRLRRNMPY